MSFTTVQTSSPSSARSHETTVAVSSVNRRATIVDPAALARENDNVNIDTGEPPLDRTIYVLVTMISLMIVTFLLGSRFKKLHRSVFMKRNLISTLVLALYFLVILLIISSAVMLSGQGLYTFELCVAATWICLILYTFAKGVIYIFLIERIHVVRAPFISSRLKDKLYMGMLILVVVSFSAVFLNCYLNPVIEFGESDGRCYFGIPGKASIPAVVADLIANVLLTGAFIYLLLPIVKEQGGTVSLRFWKWNKPKKEEGVVSVSLGNADATKKESSVQAHIRSLLWKSLIGSLMIEIPTAANMIQFWITSGRELALICLLICVVDGCWDVCVVHWLTTGASTAAERSLVRSSHLLMESRASKAQPRVRAQPPGRPITMNSRQREAQLATRSLLEEDEGGARAEEERDANIDSPRSPPGMRHTVA